MGEGALIAAKNNLLYIAPCTRAVNLWLTALLNVIHAKQLF